MFYPHLALGFSATSTLLNSFSALPSFRGREAVPCRLHTQLLSSLVSAEIDQCTGRSKGGRREIEVFPPLSRVVQEFRTVEGPLQLS